MKWPSLKFAVLGTLLAFSFTALGGQELEDAVAVTKPEVLRALESQGFSLGDLVTPGERSGVLDNAQLSKTNFKAVLEGLSLEMAEYQKAHPRAGVGMSFDEHLFDLNYLTHARARFVLVGIVNRMDLAYKTPEHCGEIRFIYRLAYNLVNHGLTVSSRLPMTVNLIFHQGQKQTVGACQNLAKAWLNINSGSSSQEILSVGPLNPAVFDRLSLKALEFNLQLSRVAASGRPDFGGHAEYLLKIFAWNGRSFQESTLENQIDRNRLENNPALLAELTKWLVEPQNVKAIDDGTAILPTKFLAKRALSIAPGGINRSGNRLFYSLLSSRSLESLRFENLETVKSPTGFLRRLNEMTCVGCHQTRGIGGFHFTGRDPLGMYAGNSVFLPGSPHFMGDLARRRAVVEQFASGQKADFSRGFAARPQERHAGKLIGSGLFNGWGAHCASGNDPSFKTWTCAPGLACKQLLDKDDGLGMGICLTEAQQVGDPCEMGRITTLAFGNDRYTRTSPKLIVTVPNAMCSPQSQMQGTRTGGFLNGNVRTLTCDNLPTEASCGPLPAARPGFNSCIGRKNFDTCLKEFSMGVGLRGCDQTHPCRDDYICAESFDRTRGSCVPPYFLFQFRVDGHPKNAVASSPL